VKQTCCTGHLADEPDATFGALARSLVADYLETVSVSFELPLFLERIERMAALIAFWGSRTNLTAKASNPREIAFHMIDSLAPLTVARNQAMLRDAFHSGSYVLDLGSGAGFPGLVLASASPASFTLVESRRKRASFLAVAAAEMSLKNVVIESQPIMQALQTEAYGHFDVVTARAYAAPSEFHSAATRVLQPGGLAILYANPVQDMALPEAERTGLDEFRSVPYSIRRGTQVIHRVLGLWRLRQTGVTGGKGDRFAFAPKRWLL
jgi:16S rRNA (guanine527-N7)-methyltransferase